MFRLKYKYLFAVVLFMVVQTVFAASTDDIPFPPHDKPTPAEVVQIKALIGKGVTSADYYYGGDSGPDFSNTDYKIVNAIKTVDYVKARKFAFVEMELSAPKDHDSDQYYWKPTYGGLTLIMIYGNGLGVPRNIDLAIKIAEKLSASGELNQDKNVIQGLNYLKQHPNSKPFDMCDERYDQIAGGAEAVCVSIRSDQEKQWLLTQTNQLSANWTPSEKTALQNVIKAANDYFQKATVEITNDSCGHSGDDYGSLSAADITQQQEQLGDAVEQLATGKIPPYTKTDFIQSDKALNKIYKDMMVVFKRETIKENEYDKKGTVPWEGAACGASPLPGVSDIIAVEKSWIVYRDAFVQLAKLRDPQAPVEAWETMLTKERMKRVKDYKENVDGYADGEYS